MTIITCLKCQGEGSLYTSKHGGNDPDVWRTGECPTCNGSGNAPCDSRGCKENAVVVNEDGEALCDVCWSEWFADTYGEANQSAELAESSFQKPERTFRQPEQTAPTDGAASSRGKP